MIDLHALNTLDDNEKIVMTGHELKELCNQAKQLAPTFSPGAMGKTAYFTDIFIKECKQGNTAEYHHPDYVVMSRAQYDKIQKKLAKAALQKGTTK